MVVLRDHFTDTIADVNHSWFTWSEYFPPASRSYWRGRVLSSRSYWRGRVPSSRSYWRGRVLSSRLPQLLAGASTFLPPPAITGGGEYFPPASRSYWRGRVLSSRSYWRGRVLSSRSYWRGRVLSFRLPQLLAGASTFLPQLLAGASTFLPQLLAGASTFLPQLLAGASTFLPLPAVIGGGEYFPPTSRSHWRGSHQKRCSLQYQATHQACSDTIVRGTSRNQINVLI